MFNSTQVGNINPKLMLIAIAAILMMSIVPVLIKWIRVDEVTIGIVRLAIAAFGISLFLLIRRKPESINRVQLGWLVLLGGVFAAHWYLYFLSIRLTDASLAAIGVATFGIHLLWLSSVIKKEKITLYDVIAIVICISGIVLASPSMSLEQHKWIGFLISIVSGFLYACLPLINQHILTISTNMRALGQFSFGLLFFSFFIPYANFELDADSWKGLIILGIVSTLFAHTLWIKASSELPSRVTAVIYYGYVPMTLLLSYIYLDEPLTWFKVCGAALVIIANVIVISSHKSVPRSETTD